MQIGTNLRLIRHRLKDGIIQVARVTGDEAHSPEILDGANIGEKFTQAIIASQVLPIVVDRLAEQGDLTNTVGGECRDLLDDLLRTSTDLRTAGGRDDTKRAHHVAPPDHLDKCVATIGPGLHIAVESDRLVLGSHESRRIPPARLDLPDELREVIDLTRPQDQIDRGPANGLWPG